MYINDPQISRNKLRLKEEVRRAIDLKAARCGVNIENNVSMPAMLIEPVENPSTAASSSVVTSAPEPLLEDSLVIDHLCSLEIITGDPPCYSQIDDDHSALNTLLLGTGTGPDAEMLLLQDSEQDSNSPALVDSQSVAPTLSLAEPFQSSPFDMVSCPSHSILPGKEEQYSASSHMYSRVASMVLTNVQCPCFGIHTFPICFHQCFMPQATRLMESLGSC